jgi:hypothetical protein
MAQNEQLGCGCKVYQKKLGSTTWNRIDMCGVHYEAKDLHDALQRISTSCEPIKPGDSLTYEQLLRDIKATAEHAIGHVTLFKQSDRGIA